jgi:hypothetical protein
MRKLVIKIWNKNYEVHFCDANSIHITVSRTHSPRKEPVMLIVFILKGFVFSHFLLNFLDSGTLIISLSTCYLVDFNFQARIRAI